MHLKSTKSAGLDQIPNNSLKIAASIVSRSLAKIFNISVKAGVFPANWKPSCMVPIFKNGSKSELGNYRPISMLSAVARVFECLIYTQLSKYFQENNFFTKYQSGFRKFHSTVTSMLKTTNDWLLNLDKGLYTGVVYFHLKKAFNMADHSILLSKLSGYGVHDIELKWFECCLSNRQQCSYLNRACSKMREIKAGVPQGSCLDPLLYLIYINDLPLVLKHATPSIFDDTQMATSAFKISDLQNQLPEDIENVFKWIADNKLSLNVFKTDFCGTLIKNEGFGRNFVY